MRNLKKLLSIFLATLVSFQLLIPIPANSAAKSSSAGVSVEDFEACEATDAATTGTFSKVRNTNNYSNATLQVIDDAAYAAKGSKALKVTGERGTFSFHLNLGSDLEAVSEYETLAFYVNIPSGTVTVPEDKADTTKFPDGQYGLKLLATSQYWTNISSSTMLSDMTVTYYFPTGEKLVKTNESGVYAYNADGTVSSTGFEGYVTVSLSDDLSISSNPYMVFRVFGSDWACGFANYSVFYFDDFRLLDPRDFAPYSEEEETVIGKYTAADRLPAIYGAGASVEDLEDCEVADAATTGTFSRVRNTNAFFGASLQITDDANYVAKGSQALRVNCQQGLFSFHLSLGDHLAEVSEYNSVAFYANIPKGTVTVPEDKTNPDVFPDGQYGLKLLSTDQYWTYASETAPFSNMTVTYYFPTGEKLVKENESGVYAYNADGTASTTGFKGYVSVSLPDDFDVSTDKYCNYIVFRVFGAAYASGFANNAVFYFDDFRLLDSEDFIPYAHQDFETLTAATSIDNNWQCPYKVFVKNVQRTDNTSENITYSINDEGMGQGGNSLEIAVEGSRGNFKTRVKLLTNSYSQFSSADYNGVAFYISIPELANAANAKAIQVMLADKYEWGTTKAVDAVYTYWFDDGAVLVKYGDDGIYPYDQNGNLTNDGFNGFVSVYYGDSSLEEYPYLHIGGTDWNATLAGKSIYIDDIRPCKFSVTEEFASGDAYYIGDTAVCVQQVGEDASLTVMTDAASLGLARNAEGLAALRSALLGMTEIKARHDVNEDGQTDICDLAGLTILANGIGDIRKNYYQNAYEYSATAQTGVKFGVINDCNLFEPGSEIPYYFELSSDTLEGETAAVEFTNEEFGVEKSATHVLSFGGEKKKIFEGSVDTAGLKNGVYTFRLTIDGFDQELSFRVGIVPKAARANKNFLYGIQGYFCNTYGSSSYYVKYQNKAASVDSLFATADYMGVNLIREDGVSWGLSQKNADEKYDASLMENYIKYADKLGMDVMWIISNTPDWAVQASYRDSGYAAWSLPPELTYWESRIKDIAKYYKDYDNIIYEIWNEADWSFFNGTEAEYIELLNSAVRTFRKADPDARILPSALVSNFEINQNPEAYVKNPILYYEAYKPWLESGDLLGIAIHDHTEFSANGIFQSIERRKTRLANAGYAENEIPDVYVTESGVWGDNEAKRAEMLVDKMLYYRADGSKSFVMYDFRDMPNNEGSWTMLSDTLQPEPCMVSVTAMIGLIGNAEFIEHTTSDTGVSYADMYYDGEKTIVPVYAYADGSDVLTVSRPHKAYDLYGNEIEATGSYTAGKKAVYLVFDGEIAASDLTFTALS